MRRGAVALVVLCIAGCGGSQAGDAPKPQPTKTEALPKSVANLPDPCKNPQAFARAYLKLVQAGKAHASRKVRRVLELEARSGSGPAKSCIGASRVDIFTTPDK